MGRTLTNLLVHVVFSTKGHEPIVSDELRARLYPYMGGILRRDGAEALAIGGTADHIHLAIKIKSDRALSDLVRTVKANSSKWVNEHRLCTGRFAWQNGYGGFSVSASQIDKVRRYIDNQIEHHRAQTFEEELVGLLAKHGIQCDPVHLWD